MQVLLSLVCLWPACPEDVIDLAHPCKGWPPPIKIILGDILFERSPTSKDCIRQPGPDPIGDIGTERTLGHMTVMYANVEIVALKF